MSKTVATELVPSVGQVGAIPSVIDVPAEDVTANSAPVSGKEIVIKRPAAIQGYVDRIERQRVSGWAWSRNNPDAIVDIEVRLDDQLLATAPANRLRPDLVKANLGDGRKGYDISLDEVLTPDQCARVTIFARLGAGGAAVPLLNGTLHAAQSASLPAVALAKPAGSARSDETSPLVLQISDLISRLQRQLAEMAQALERMDARFEQQERARETVDKQIAHLEVVQTRIDAFLSDEGAARQAGSRRRSFERGMAFAVASACVLSVVSLIVGLLSVLG